MPLQLYTARIGYRGDDALDVTRKSASPDGIVFAPSWDILNPALAARHEAAELRARADRLDAIARDLRLIPESTTVTTKLRARADAIEAAAWDRYVPAYLQEMRASYRQHRGAWVALLARPSVTLLCYCTHADHCHRFLLRTRILPAFGAVDCGERAAEAPRQLDLG